MDDRNYRSMIDPDEALQSVLDTAIPRPPRRVSLAEASGHGLAEEIRADRDYPPFSRAMMDGYAVHCADAGAALEVVGEVPAGTAPVGALSGRGCWEIMTGAVCPPGTEAVVPYEQTRRDGSRVLMPNRIIAGDNIDMPGADCRAGTVVLKPGDRLTPMAVAVLASFGIDAVQVVPRPSLAIIVTGTELIPPGQSPAAWQIRNSNGPMLLAMAGEAGIRSPRCLSAGDRLDAIVESLRQTSDCDVVVLSGGVSAGKYDLVVPALQQYGAEIIFHKVTQKPAKPLLLARKQAEQIFGLPGNPLASHLGFHRYVVAGMRRMEGKPPVEPGLGKLAAPLHPAGGRTLFWLARAERADDSFVDWRLHPLPAASSADVFSPCQANCYARVPPGNAEVPAGTIVSFTWIAPATL
jgi:molybdenum cofactor synthesis domain-containing protein